MSNAKTGTSLSFFLNVSTSAYVDPGRGKKGRICNVMGCHYPFSTGIRVPSSRLVSRIGEQSEVSDVICLGHTFIACVGVTNREETGRIKNSQHAPTIKKELGNKTNGARETRKKREL